MDAIVPGHASEIILTQMHTTGDGLAMFKMIAQLPHFANLAHLNPTQMNIEDEGVCVLDGPINFSQLTHLWLGSNKIIYEGVLTLCNSSSLASLESLDLAYKPLTLASLGRLDRSKELKSQKHLSLVHTSMTQGNLGDKTKYYFDNPGCLRNIDVRRSGIKKSVSKQMDLLTRYAQAELMIDKEAVERPA